ncbi:hypothetical protein GCM10020218_058420 [Dactylosporangium vinaceum]
MSAAATIGSRSAGMACSSPAAELAGELRSMVTSWATGIIPPGNMSLDNTGPTARAWSARPTLRADQSNRSDPYVHRSSGGRERGRLSRCPERL